MQKIAKREKIKKKLVGKGEARKTAENEGNILVRIKLEFNLMTHFLFSTT